MPDGTSSVGHESGNDNTERLNNAIDRMLSGGPSPVFNDPEMNELLQLAARLHDELPDDLPDPAFRLDLKQQLTSTSIRAFPGPQRSVASPMRFPWVAAFSAIAAVLVAAVSVGALGIWLDNDSSTGVSPLVGSSGSQITATTFGLATITAEAISTNQLSPAGAAPSSEQTGLTTAEPTEELGVTQPSDTTMVPTLTPTSAITNSTATASSEPTNGPSLASVPPVDEQTVEQGPRPAADGGGGAPSANISYVLDTTLPDLDDDAQVYRFAPPSVAPETFVAEVGKALGIEGEITSDAAMGQTVYHLFGENGSFHWTPATGAFTLSTADSGDGSGITLDQVVVGARDWLAKLGYPVQQLSSEIRAEPLDATSWRLDARYNAMPEIGYGHPLGVTVYVNDDGDVTEATGYWLEAVASDTAELLPADQIWQAVSSGDGLWTGGGIVEVGGEFRADTMQITYVLTRDPSGELVLQPVVQTSGEFTTADGLSTARISCFVRASRTEDDYNP